MRNLTIKRNKRFVGCLCTLTVCIEDAESGEITVGCVACRKLGKLKNGEEATYPITNDETHIYVIADTLSKDYCCEVCRIDSGENDVSLSGRCCFNPAAGNAFRFDGNCTEEALQNRKKGTKIGWIVLTACFVIGIIIGLFIVSPLLNNKAEPKAFEIGDMNIMLTDGFSAVDPGPFAALYESNKVLVFVEKSGFTDTPSVSEMTVAEYTDMLIDLQSVKIDAKRQNEGELTYFITNSTVNGDDLVYYIFVYKSSAAFWVVQFVSHKENESANRPLIFEWARSVTFDNVEI